ncbi:preprotein translocase subunit SecE [Patescibacteria group bacterium]|nr:preprotein translocase subunit SecE [Patescibacteria group bacterium]MBU1953302.1 preprotein translocase subunit SecE [Patescibacteria group bacterium]
MSKVIKFFNQSLEELKKIQWPSKKETVRLTGLVIGISAFAGLVIMLFDYIFKRLLTLLLTK